MNLIYGETGGRPRSIDDLYLIQSETLKAISGPLKHVEDQRGGFIVYGCQPDGIQNTISPGMVFLGGEFLGFDGATNVIFPVTFGVMETLIMPLQYEDGNTKPTRRLRVASIDPSADFTHSFTISASSYQELNDLFVHSFGDQAVSGTKTFRDNLLAKNLNVYDELIRLTNALNLANIAIQNFNNTKVTQRIAGTGWINLTLEPGFSYGLSGYNQPQVRRTEDGFVHMRGVVELAPNASGVMAVLPPQFYAGLETRVVINSIGADFHVQVAIAGSQIFIFPLGVPSSSNRTFLIDNITYYVDSVI